MYNNKRTLSPRTLIFICVLVLMCCRWSHEYVFRDTRSKIKGTWTLAFKMVSDKRCEYHRMMRVWWILFEQPNSTSGLYIDLFNSMIRVLNQVVFFLPLGWNIGLLQISNFFLLDGSPLTKDEGLPFTELQAPAPKCFSRFFFRDSVIKLPI